MARRYGSRLSQQPLSGLGWGCLLFILFLSGLPAAGQDVPAFFVEASVDNTQPYIGQQVQYIFRLFDSGVLNNPLYEPPTFEGFWQIDLGDVSQSLQVINGQSYTVTELRAALFPTRSGEIVIAPARLVLPETVFEAERVVFSNPVTVQARPLPGGAPAGFTGAVGQFTMEASLDRNQAQAGEVMMLTVTVIGDGAVGQLLTPSVTPPKGWRMVENAARFTAAAENGVVVGRKTFSFALLAETAGVFTLEPIVLHFFDPLSAVYRQISTGSIAVEALPNPGSSSGGEGMAAVMSTPLPLKPVNDWGTPAALSPFFWLLWLLPPLAVAAALGAKRVRERIEQFHRRYRQQRALQTALRRLEELPDAVKQDRDQTLKLVMNIVNAYVSDKLGLPAREDTVLQHSPDWGLIPEASQQSLNRLIEIIREGMYAPAEQVMIEALLKQARDGLMGVDALW